MPIITTPRTARNKRYIKKFCPLQRAQENYNRLEIVSAAGQARHKLYYLYH